MRHPLRKLRAFSKTQLDKLLIGAGRTGAPQAVLDSLRGNRLTKKVASRFEGTDIALTMRQAESMPLGPGKFYVRLCYKSWSSHVGEYIKLYCRGEQIYGNVIEPPEAGKPVEYRNMVGTSANPEDYAINLRGKFSVSVSPYPFVTREQARFDARFDVRQHGKVFYSIRGNTVAPERVVFTFPGFTLSTSSISYTVSYLKGLSPTELLRTAVVVFQDRYYVPGSYMLVDSQGRSVVEDVRGAMTDILDNFGLDSSQALLFGASKGASIALFYGQFFPKSHLVVSTPQLNLPYYFTKPAFRENLFMFEAMRGVVAPGDLLQEYCNEGRRIDFFYTLKDELSNQSLVEFPQDAANFVSHRISGVHTDVAKRGLPSMMGVIRQFIHGQPLEPRSKIEVGSVRLFEQGEHLVGVDVQLGRKLVIDSEHNWYLERRFGQSVLRYEMDEVSLGAALKTSSTQLLDTRIDSLDGEWALRYVTENGTTDAVILSHWSDAVRKARISAGVDLGLPGDFHVDVRSQGSYTVIDGYDVSVFNYCFVPGAGSDNCELVVVLGEAPCDLVEAVSTDQPTLAIDSSTFSPSLSQFIMRVGARVYASRLRIFVTKGYDSQSFVDALSTIDWKTVLIDRLG